MIPLEELAAIEARHRATTPGDWRPVSTHYDSGACVASLGRFTAVESGPCVACHIGGPRIPDDRASWASDANALANAVFIAHAHADVPRLVAALRESHPERMRARVARWIDQLAKLEERCEQACSEAATAKAERDVARAIAEDEQKRFRQAVSELEETNKLLADAQRALTHALPVILNLELERDRAKRELAAAIALAEGRT